MTNSFQFFECNVDYVLLNGDRYFLRMIVAQCIYAKGIISVRSREFLNDQCVATPNSQSHQSSALLCAAQRTSWRSVGRPSNFYI